MPQSYKHKQNSRHKHTSIWKDHPMLGSMVVCFVLTLASEWVCCYQLVCYYLAQGQCALCYFVSSRTTVCLCCCHSLVLWLRDCLKLCHESITDIMNWHISSDITKRKYLKCLHSLVFEMCYFFYEEWTKGALTAQKIKVSGPAFILSVKCPNIEK